MLWGDRHQKATKLIRLGYDYLDQDEPRKALKVAAKIRKLGNSGAWEIAARAFWAMGEEGEAIKTLEEGVKKYPQVGILWSYLGEYLSDSGSYEQAIAAFEQARTHGSTWSEYNIALVLSRMNRHQEALDRVRALPEGEDGPPMAVRKWLEAWSLVHLGRPEEAVELMDFVLEEHEKWVTAGTMARLLSCYALALHRSGRSDRGLKHAWDAIGLDKANTTAAEVVREAAGLSSAWAREWRIQVEGRWHEPVDVHRLPGFFATYFVVADTPEEALELIRPFEPEPVRESLKVSKAENIGPGDGPKGVVRAHPGYTFFDT